MACPTAVKVAGSSPENPATSTVFGPGVLPRVSLLAARPSASVVSVPAESVPPPAVTAKVTTAPEKTEPFWSNTSTTSGCSNCVFVGARCSSPEILASPEGRSLSGVSQRMIVSPDPEARMAPSGENDTEETQPQCPPRVAISVLAARSHSLTVPSRDPETRVVPSGENDTEKTAPGGCPGTGR